MEREWLDCLAITFLGEPQNCRELNCDTVRFDIPISSSKTNSLIWSYWKSDKKSAVSFVFRRLHTRSPVPARFRSLDSESSPARPILK